MTIDGKEFFGGTSGTTDYLRDLTGAQRFWSVSVPRSEPDDIQICDGLHDETAPIQYLCAMCFPGLRGGDLAEPQDDEYDEAR